MKKTLYLFANWKMYLTPRESARLAKQYVLLSKKLSKQLQMVIFPSALAFERVHKQVQKSRVAVGAQNVHWIDRAGTTGEVSARMYKEDGARYALVGHSERRHLYHETNQDVRRKVEACLAASIIPVLCVGETKSQRTEGMAEEVLESQLRSALTDITWPARMPLIIAYEPVWAIAHGTGKHERGELCDPKDAERVHEMIRRCVAALVKHVQPIILFGGSVRPATVEGYLEEGLIQGVLVGAAATEYKEWQAIVKNAEMLTV